MQKMPFPEPSHKFPIPLLSLEDLGIWGVLVTLPNHLVSQGLLLVLPGSEDGNEERGNWPFFPIPLTVYQSAILLSTFSGPSTGLGLRDRAHGQK